ncbi:hypothetical protein Ahy_B06g082515 [Arachis hypogaea]|uniref:Replication protein A 70 kDa DNA-binding subunit B/D first OB fold domain-containing protein n=1 Tax=Arachis hypogaea TaxID=3818 RepID=A0A444YNP0_ARAHY|nr:hypothetical protein Ahy_B06g082515 [Arachis hypogaea]
MCAYTSDTVEEEKACDAFLSRENRGEKNEIVIEKERNFGIIQLIQIVKAICTKQNKPTLLSYGNFPLPYLIEMVYLNEDGGKIHASIKRAFVSRFMNLLEEGISYQIRYFGVGLNKGYFKTTHHEYVVNLNQQLPESSSIPRYGFKFVSFDTLNALGYDCTYLVDVVGYFVGIENERTLEKNDKSTKKIMECTFFGNYAHKLNVFLGSGNKDGAVVVLQFVRKRLFYKIPYMAQRCSSILKMQLSSNLKIGDFVRFEEPRGNIGGIPNETAFLKIYQGKIIEKYRIKIGVIDDSDCACFIVFDKEAKQVLGKSCVEILDPRLLDVDYTGGLLPISKTSSIIEGEKVESAKNLLLEFSNEVAANDESELLENAITPTKRLSSESEESKVEGDTSTCKKIKIEKET